MTHYCSYRTCPYLPDKGDFLEIQLRLIHFFNFFWSYRAPIPSKFQSLLLLEFFLFGMTHFNINFDMHMSMGMYLLNNVDVNHNCFIVFSGQHRTSQGRRTRRRETCCESMKVDSRQALSIANSFVLMLLTLITLLKHWNFKLKILNVIGLHWIVFASKGMWRKNVCT